MKSHKNIQFSGFLIPLLWLSIVICAVVTVSCQPNSNQNNTVDNIETKKTVKKKVDDSIHKNKNLIRVCQGETPPKSLDPIIFENKLHEITFHIYDRLLKWDEKGNIIPDLAVSWKRLDNTKFQLALRRGVRFHNGEVFDANSVKFTIDRLINPKNESQGSPFLNTISKVEIVDPYTINIITNKPDYLLMRKLSLVQILPEQYFKKVGEKAFGRYPIGTGPYKFNRWLKNGSLVLTKNKHYWVEDVPIIDTVVFKFIKVYTKSRKEQLDALFRGEVDLITELPGLHSIKVQKNPGTKVIKFPNGAKVHKMLFNSQKKPFSDIKIREAVNLALNRDILIKVLAKGNGRKIATNSVEVEFGHNKNLKPYIYDIKKAKDILQKLKAKNIKIKIAVTDETDYIAQAVKKDLERIGIASDIKPMTNSEMAKTLISAKNNKSFDYDLVMFSGVDPLLHVGFLYGLSVYSKGPFSMTKNPEIDKLFEKLSVTYDEKAQLELCHKLEEITYKNYWYTPVFQVIGTYGAVKDLKLKDSATSFVDLTTAKFK